ncbi:pyridoxal phosphate-dependent transferase [Aspergillus multicolor]|uniref:pyridoxal phosphate-dependent transferase n=1 Tax=Aspergillus multicolor TaxID=41759 RepID=UPI003CCCCB96
MRPASREFLQFLRHSADEVGAVLIFDEVVTSRLHYHGLQGALDVQPDMTTLGKYLGGGLSFGAFGGSARIMDLFDPAIHGTAGALHYSGTLGDRARDEANGVLQRAGLDCIRFIGYGSAVGIWFRGTGADSLRECFYFSMLNREINIGKRGFLFMSLVHSDASVDRIVEGIAAFVEKIVGGDASV